MHYSIKEVLPSEGFYLKRRSFIFKSLFGSLFAWLVVASLASAFESSYRVGLDLNEIRCLPWRAYLITFGKGPFKRDQYVAFKSEHGLMGPKFEGLLIGKQVGAVAGDRVIVKNDVLSVNGKVIGPLYLIERLKVKPGHFDRDEIVPVGKLLALGTEARSYDGRYWGFVDTNVIIGWVQPLF